MNFQSIPKAGMILAALLCSAAVANAQSPAPAPAHTQLQKTVGQAKPEVLPALIVMNAKGATLQGGKLTLTGIGTNSIIFADRPKRAAGHALTTHLIEEWTVGNDSFAKDPPNATVSAFSKDGATIRDAVVVLKSPKLDGDRLTFDVDVLEGDLTGADGPASVFIDIIGLPFTPLSYAGVARRTAYRAAVYSTAAAAAAYPAYAPPPYYYRPPCGYYPYPPCY